jgi:Tfp pilus assembly protein PilE
MGQQQLLLIVLGVIIVGVAIAVGVTQFKSSAVDSNRQAVIGDLVNLAAKAQRFYRTPTSLAGGGQNFNTFYLTASDTGNANGSYSVTTDAPTALTYSAGSVTAVSASASTIYIVGCGKETGNDATNKVKVYATVTADNITTSILN